MCKVTMYRVLIAVLFIGFAAGAAADDSWVPESLRTNFQNASLTAVDQDIKIAVNGYLLRMAALDDTTPLVQKYLPRLQDKLLALYREYNQNKGRYPSDCFTAQECLDWFTRDMDHYLESLEAGTDPAVSFGTWNAKACWITDMGILGRYDLVLPSDYSEFSPIPLYFCYQDSPSSSQMATINYGMIQSIQKGYPIGWTNVNDKMKAFLIDAMKDVNYDPLRIHGIGFSFGGKTAIVQEWRYPDIFASIVPLGNDLRDAMMNNILHINAPIRILCGTSDSFYGTNVQQYNMLTAISHPAEFIDYDSGHTGDIPFRQDITLVSDFTDLHTQDPYPTSIKHLIEHKRYSKAFWVDGILIADSSYSDAWFTVDVLTGNRIDVTASDKIAGLEMDLNTQLVDMTQPITVHDVTGGGDTVVYAGMPSLDLVITLRSGTGYWRDPSECLLYQLMAMRESGDGEDLLDLTINADTDVAVHEGNASDAAGIEASTLGVANNADYAKLFLMHFDISAMPAGALLYSATLKVYCSNDRDPRGSTARVFGLNETWNGNVTFETLDGSTPWSGGDIVASMDATHADEQINEGSETGALDGTLNPAYNPGAFPADDWTDCWVEFDVTAVVAGWINGSRDNCGLALSNTNRTPTQAYGWTEMVWNTMESSNVPQLAIKYTGGDPDALKIDTSSLPAATQNSTYGPVTLTASGGTSPYTFTVTSSGDALPAGLSLASGGTLSGTPTESGTFSIELQVADSDSDTAVRTLQLTVAADTDPDLDNDGMDDDWESDYSVDDPDDDPDLDGLSNLLEFQEGTDPHNEDTDGDGLLDGIDISPLVYDSLAGSGGSSTVEGGCMPATESSKSMMLLLVLSALCYLTLRDIFRSSTSRQLNDSVFRLRKR